ncbi:MAG TPA: GIY-YIG nuclease family protein [Candidatus Peribacterales bacterium]|nr:GIY-YIG nuclease family protein [Candidatus Peribacterales bacterium]
MPKKIQALGKAETRLKELRARITKAPQTPGVYRWIGDNGDVLYVGKAKNLKNRLKSYVQKKPDLSIGPWKLALLQKITDVDWTVTETEIEALMLETNLIKELKPKYNVLMKDDKNYVYVRMSMKDAYPTVSIIRRMEEDGAKYFGPFMSAHHIHRTLDMLHDVYGWRACKRSLDLLNKQPLSSPARRPVPRSPKGEVGSKSEGRSKAPRGAESRGLSTRSFRSDGTRSLEESNLKPCLDSQIGKCNGLCCGKITEEEYRNRIEAVMQFFKGDRTGVTERLKEKMRRSAEKKLFEEAAKLRDTLNYIESLEEQQIVSDTSGADTDYFGVALLSDKAHVVVLRERGGKLVGERSYALAGQADTHGEVLSQFLPQYYIATEEVPDTIICAEEPEERDTLEAWLTNQKRRNVSLHIPERGKKSKLLTMAEKNAEEKVRQQLARWEATTKKVDDALMELKEILDLPAKPKRIECYDISHLGGTETVGSMVVFVDGKAKNSDYRSFTLRSIRKGEIDDYKSLREVLSRRLRHLAAHIKREEDVWSSRSITFGKVKKGEKASVEAIIERHPKYLQKEEKNVEDYVVREDGIIIGLLRAVRHTKSIVEIATPWLDDDHRDSAIESLMIRKILTQEKTGKIYTAIPPECEEQYATLGFRHVIDTPPLFANTTPSTILMVYIAKDHKTDKSLSSPPDLLVLDGGKGQLAVGVEVLKAMKFMIPIISLAKREEEVFMPENRDPLPFHKDSEARFLLMRLRDEAHRSANIHRGKRLKNALNG